MKKSTRRGSLFGKLIGSYVIFSMAAILLLIVAVLISFVFSYGNVLQENFPGITVGGWNNPESRWHPEYEWLGGKAGCTVPCGDSLWQEADHADGIYEGTASGCLFVKRRCAAGNTKWKEEILDVRAESRRVLLSDFLSRGTVFHSLQF